MSIRFAMLSLNPYPEVWGQTQIGENAVMEGIKKGYDPHVLVSMLIPSSGHILAMLIDNEDSEEYRELDGLSYPAELYYDRIAALHESMSTLRPRYESMFDALYEAMKVYAPAVPRDWVEKEADSWQGDVTLPRLFTLPRLQDLDYSHTFALDIFLKEVEYLPGNVQRGPMIHSLSDGIVVAAESGWVGFPRTSQSLSFLKGGISPKAGNGVIIYSPEEKRYFLYFHLYDALVEKGQIVRRGQAIGHGGNTGINARKKGGGDHLHFEIFDAQKGKPLRNTQIIAFLQDSARKNAVFSLAVPSE
ncbi:MAG: M23 family metallopeptidase [Rectinema sp.]